MAKIRRPPKGIWKVGDIATFGGVVGRVVAADKALGGWPLIWVTTDPAVNYGTNRAGQKLPGQCVRFDLEGKFQSWHVDPLLFFVRRPKKSELAEMQMKGPTGSETTPAGAMSVSRNGLLGGSNEEGNS